MEKRDTLVSYVYTKRAHRAQADYRDVPGVCIESGPLKMWIPVSISRSGITAAADSDCSDELCANECVMINYQPISGQPARFEIETRAGTFWSPIAHKSSKRAGTHKLTRPSYHSGTPLNGTPLTTDTSNITDNHSLNVQTVSPYIETMDTQLFHITDTYFGPI